jgi:hypothetical protein
MWFMLSYTTHNCRVHVICEQDGQAMSNDKTSVQKTPASFLGPVPVCITMKFDWA